MKLLSQEEAIYKFRAVHGEQYDYSTVEYQNSRSPITIICLTHGPFKQIAGSHAMGNGCPQCGLEKIINGKNLWQETTKVNQSKIIISRFRAVHGDKYDYSMVEYKTLKSKVTIVCRTHGQFKQTPGCHLEGNGCLLCGKQNRAKLRTFSQDKVIAKFKAVHGDKYDYSMVEYRNGKFKVDIICPEHGQFKQAPRDHAKGHGCQLCGYEKVSKFQTLSQSEAISKFKKTHGNTYDYSMVKYEKSGSKVTIICPLHGPFRQGISSHQGGNGCPECGRQKVADFHRLCQEEAISKFKATHGDKYDYSMVKYRKANIKITIICPSHGPFRQIPNSHMRNGCPKCRDEKTSKRLALSQQEVVSRFKSINGDKYDYSMVKYKNNSSKVSIICPKHGLFEQIASVHMNGGGCPRCMASRGEDKIESVLLKTKVQYQRQWTHKLCGSGRLRFDFAVWTKRGIRLIEYQGAQHYRQINFSGNPEKDKKCFEATLRRDLLKRCWCKKNKVKLLEIPYFACKNLEQDLRRFLLISPQTSPSTPPPADPPLIPQASSPPKQDCQLSH